MIEKINCMPTIEQKASPERELSEISRKLLELFIQLFKEGDQSKDTSKHQTAFCVVVQTYLDKRNINERWDNLTQQTSNAIMKDLRKMTRENIESIVVANYTNYI